MRLIDDMCRVLPILFNTEMTRAILDGRKTVTRRALKHPFEVHPNGFITKPRGNERLCPYTPPYQPGDILYVRETWGISNFDYDEEVAYIVYKASENEKDEGCLAVKLPNDKFEKLYDSMSENSPEWRPSIHMPREGVNCHIHPEADYFEGNQKMMFEELWNSTLKKGDLESYGWDANPWVWVVEFELCEKPEPCIIRGGEPADDERPCIGYSVSEDDDEPCEMCKGCKVCSGNDD